VTRLQINWDASENIVPQATIINEPQPFGFELSNSMGAEFAPGQQKTMDQINAARPPVFVENSMDCHNVAMNID
jgi:hypothetical protein